MQYNIARLLTQRTGTGITHYDLAHEMGDAALVFWELANDPRRIVFRSHDLRDFFGLTEPDAPHICESLESGALRLLATYRDLRDVAASCKQKMGKHGVELGNLIAEAVAAHRFMRAIPISERVLWQRYEDMYDNVEAAVSEVAVALDLSIDEALIREVAAACSINAAMEVTSTLKQQIVDSMRRLRMTNPQWAVELRQRQREESWVMFDPDTMLHHNHISPTRGVPGTWSTVLSDDEIAGLYEQHSDWLREYGYLDGTPIAHVGVAS
ncbi:MAG: hypothetical protein O3A46_03700 [Candidatus Poribacteria bacterium]|nr:hypothetical protein [Candidatus Poribacteria bacterium]